MENKIANINDDINNICIVLSNMDEYNIKKFKAIQEDYNNKIIKLITCTKSINDNINESKTHIKYMQISILIMFIIIAILIVVMLLNRNLITII